MRNNAQYSHHSIRGRACLDSSGTSGVLPTCETISTSLGRYGLCGSVRIIELTPLFTNPWDPGPASAGAMAA